MNSVNDILNHQVKSKKTPSLQYLFFDESETIHKFVSGYADVKNGIQANEGTIYNGFSVTKTFTSIAILQLVAKGEISLDDTIKKILSGFQYDKSITVKHILTHSSGIPNPIPLRWVHLESEHKTFDRDRFFNGIFRRTPKLKFKPGSKFLYSNLGFVVLGELIEKVSGMPYEDFIQIGIIDKLNILNSELGFNIDPVKHARGYHKRYSISSWVLGFLMDKKKFMDEAEGPWKPFNPMYMNGAAYGGLIGTAEAFKVYLQELLKQDSILLSKNYKELLFTENILSNGKASGMCLSWFKDEIDSHTYFAHAGGGGGYYCEIRLYPKLKRGSVIMFNRSGMKDERFLDKVDRFFLNNDELIIKS